MAPETLASNRGKCTSLSDVFSFGMVLYCMVTRSHPFPDETSPFIIGANIARGERPLIPPSVPCHLQRLLISCWDADPAKRPPFNIMHQKYFEGLLDIFSIIDKMTNYLLPRDILTLARTCRISFHAFTTMDRIIPEVLFHRTDISILFAKENEADL
eukprot:TRINITY_DN21446_c0_g1_i1.p1 TRINITY_DN21446_c0_g1~~TRINITY_DN21446_c0_g1_i1.p1  ORF type:complete len:157 (-),score=10.96 TRINITY_DN21446_c0_g1_i1:342-812(-)